mmetsp:Transcript_117175/g.326451  ORF Transcript_117175/g.326451 Transcript_117175/m.326451 type:complete len:155 (+) Transcript_117175:170-634(+)
MPCHAQVCSKMPAGTSAQGTVECFPVAANGGHGVSSPQAIRGGGGFGGAGCASSARGRCLGGASCALSLPHPAVTDAAAEATRARPGCALPQVAAFVVRLAAAAGKGNAAPAAPPPTPGGRARDPASELSALEQERLSLVIAEVDGPVLPFSAP